MIVLKIASILFIILNLVIAFATVQLFGLKKRGWNFADIAFPLFAFEFYLISDKAYYNSLLPHLLLALSLLAFGITLYFIFNKKDFTYRKVFKFFWRASFILTFLLYLSLVIAVLTLPN
ncbi:TPA: DUF3397 family protein [Streptococcus suis]